MTTPIKTFHAKLSDEYDEYPEAFVAIHEFSITTQETFKSVDCECDYSENGVEFQAAAYKVNFWNSSQAKTNGKRSRPLQCESDNGLTDVFVVDLEHPESIQIMNSELPGKEKSLHLMRKDLTRRFQ